MEEQEIYNLVCKDKFNNIEKTMKENHMEVIGLLRGQNSNTGIIDEVRSLKKFNKCFLGVAVFVLSILAVQMVRWLFARL